jgi:hypothetical protein
MQALAAYFDSNKDLVLNQLDDGWNKFGVWQDLNTDGIQQEGEFNNLAFWGIESIALSYNADSQAYQAAEGNVQVFGQMATTYGDGSNGLAEDVAFAVASQPISMRATPDESGLIPEVTTLVPTTELEQASKDPVTGIAAAPGTVMTAPESSDPLFCRMAGTECDNLTGFLESFQATEVMLQQLFTALDADWSNVQGSLSNLPSDAMLQDIFNPNSPFADNLQSLIERQFNCTITL